MKESGRRRKGLGVGRVRGERVLGRRGSPTSSCIVGLLETEELEGEAVKVGEGGGMEDEREGGTVKATTGRC